MLEVWVTVTVMVTVMVAVAVTHFKYYLVNISLSPWL